MAVEHPHPPDHPLPIWCNPVPLPIFSPSLLPMYVHGFLRTPSVNNMYDFLCLITLSRNFQVISDDSSYLAQRPTELLAYIGSDSQATEQVTYSGSSVYISRWSSKSRLAASSARERTRWCTMSCYWMLSSMYRLVPIINQSIDNESTKLNSKRYSHRDLVT